MCGIAGFWSPGGLDESAIAVLGKMTSAIRHRGPDDAGCWSDSRLGIALGHRRLSVIDLSPEGRQPMTSASGRYVIIFNGEIYNFVDLRRHLEAEAVRFRGHSDTEVMLAAIERDGILKATQRFAGMFGFALFDRRENLLHLVRDRLGEKPLYHGRAGDVLLFGSELKALRAHPAWRGEVDRNALALFLRHNYVPAPYSIYKGIRKVMPGTIATFNLNAPVAEPTEQMYWSARNAVEAGVHAVASASDAEVLDELDAILRQTVRREMISDVPLGAFLSGGVDSSLIVALMQHESARPVRTFTIGFQEPEYNEAGHAKAVAQHLKTDHTELYVTPAEALAVVPRLPHLYDEPFADSSQIPTFLVSELARRHVTVSLSGDGGDELFGGYDRYFLAQRVWSLLTLIPVAGRRVIAKGIRSVSPGRWDLMLGMVGLTSRPRAARRITGDRLHKVAVILSTETQEGIYHDFVSHWREPASVTLGATEPPTPLTDPLQQLPLDGLLSRMMYLDLITYLPDDILVKVDRASMGVSLESRAPFLDHSVVEFAWRMPAHMRVKEGRGKWPLRQLLDRYVPRALVDRPKMGFGVPIDHWLRGSLKEWAAALIDPSRLKREGFFDPKPIAQKWREHQDRSQNWHYLLWDVLMFQSWLEAQ
jgi:asparagine synthase (glutamine-hydrolysing)